MVKIKFNPTLFAIIDALSHQGDIVAITLKELSNGVDETKLPKDYANYVAFSTDDEESLSYLTPDRVKKIEKDENPNFWVSTLRYRAKTGRVMDKLFTYEFKTEKKIEFKDVDKFITKLKKYSRHMNDNTPENNKFSKKLKRILKIQSYSEKEQMMTNEIVNQLRGIKNVRFEVVEENGGKNIYVTKGNAATFPCVVAHTDTVHEIINSYNVFKANDYFFAMNGEKKEMTGIGGDDKVGIFIALELIKSTDNIKAMFFWGEEIGCWGSFSCDTSFFKNVGYILQADRRGNNEIIRYGDTAELFNDQFYMLLEPIFDKYNYKVATGSWTDVVALKNRMVDVCMMNIGCGYYEPHTNKEIVSISDVKRCYTMMQDMIKLLGEKKYKHKDDFKYKKEFTGGFEYYQTLVTCPKCKSEKHFLTDSKKNELVCVKCNPELAEKAKAFSTFEKKKSLPAVITTSTTTSVVNKDAPKDIPTQVKLHLSVQLLDLLREYIKEYPQSIGVQIANLMLMSSNGILSSRLLKNHVNYIGVVDYSDTEFSYIMDDKIEPDFSNIWTKSSRNKTTLKVLASKIWEQTFLNDVKFWDNVDKFCEEFKIVREKHNHSTYTGSDTLVG